MLMVVILERNPVAAAPLGFAETINQHSNGFMLVSDFDHGPRYWTNLLGPFVGANDRLLIFEATNLCGGLAPQTIWRWFEEAVGVGGVTQSSNPFIDTD